MLSKYVQCKYLFHVWTEGWYFYFGSHFQVRWQSLGESGNAPAVTQLSCNRGRAWLKFNLVILEPFLGIDVSKYSTESELSIHISGRGL